MCRVVYSEGSVFGVGVAMTKTPVIPGPTRRFSQPHKSFEPPSPPHTCTKAWLDHSFGKEKKKILGGVSNGSMIGPLHTHKVFFTDRRMIRQRVSFRNPYLLIRHHVLSDKKEREREREERGAEQSRRTDQPMTELFVTKHKVVKATNKPGT